MNKKGFTLLELLAVIVVLAIIALIVTPFVTKAINQAKEGSSKNSAQGILEAADIYYGTKILNKDEDFNGVTFTFLNGNVTKSDNNLPDFTFKGEKPISGTVTMDINGVATINNLKFGDYYCSGSTKEKVICSKEQTIEQEPIIVKTAGLYLENTLTLAKVTVNDEEVDATWENIKLAYPNAFATAGTISPNGYSSYLKLLSGDLIIGDDITTIGSLAFYDCKSLTSITIPNSVTTIRDYAFYNCTKLTSVTIPNSVTTIGSDVFSNCKSLTSVTIPNNVTTTGDFTFYGCTSLASITIPNNVITIGNYAFKGCTSLTSLTIPNSVKTIGYDAFEGCTSLTSLTIPNSVTTIGSSAFRNVPHIYYNGTATGSPWGAVAIN